MTRQGRPGPTLDQLRDVARIYATAVYDGNPHPARAVMAATGVPKATAHRWLNQAREYGLLPLRPAAGHLAEHEPRRAHWRVGEPSWLACRACRMPWPCPDAEPLATLLAHEGTDPR